MTVVDCNELYSTQILIKNMDRKVIVLGPWEEGIRDSTVKWERAVKIGHALDGRMFVAMYFCLPVLPFLFSFLILQCAKTHLTK